MAVRLIQSRILLSLLAMAWALGASGCCGLRAVSVSDRAGSRAGPIMAGAGPIIATTATRVAGPLPSLPDEVQEQSPGKVLPAIYKVCFAPEDGHLTGIEPVLGIEGADAQIMSTLRTWTWRVYVPDYDGPLCFVQALQFYVRGKSRFVDAADQVLARRKLYGDLPHLPLLVIQMNRGRTVRTGYRVCLDRRSGYITSLKPLPGIPGADRAIQNTLLTWAWEFQLPAALSTGFCLVENFEFIVDGRVPSEQVLQSRRIGGAQPQLPPEVRSRYRPLMLEADYRMCVDGATGQVTGVTPLPGVPGASGTDDAIVATLMEWRYAPLPEVPKACFVEHLHLSTGP